MKGYIIENQYGEFLAQQLFWFPHDSVEEAWIHPENILAFLNEHAKNWDVKPTTAYPVTMGETIIIEKSFPFRFS